MCADTKTRDRIAFALFHESYVGEQGDVIYSRTRWNELQGSELEYWLRKADIALAAMPARTPREKIAMGLFQANARKVVNMDAAASAEFWDVGKESVPEDLSEWYQIADAVIATMLASK